MDKLRSKSVKKLLPKEGREISFLHADEDITKSAFLAFLAAGVYSLPVKSKSGKIVGILDQADFTRLIVQIFTSGADRPGLTVGDVMNLSGRDKLVSVFHSDNLQIILNALQSQNVHRIIVQYKSNVNKQWLVSQIDVVSYFCDKLPKKVANRSLDSLSGRKNLRLKNQILVIVHESDSVLFAIQLMDRHAVTAVAVTGTDGKLVGNISLKDVPNALNHLFKTCAEFVANLAPLGHDVACVELSTSFGQLLTGFKATKFHRFWVIDKKKRLIGVVSLSDVVRTLRRLN